MSGIRRFITGIIIGVAAGLWAGINIGKGNPITHNPFNEPTTVEKVKQAGKEVLQESKEALHDSKKAIQDRLNDN